MATLRALQSLYTDLSRDTKFKLCGTASLAAIGGLVLRRYFKKKSVHQSNDNNLGNNVNHNSQSRRILIPLSGHGMFWGSYALSAALWALTVSSRFQSFCSKYIPRIMSHRFTRSLADLLPPIPSTLSQSFRLGQLEK